MNEEPILVLRSDPIELSPEVLRRLESWRKAIFTPPQKPAERKPKRKRR